MFWELFSFIRHLARPFVGWSSGFPLCLEVYSVLLAINFEVIVLSARNISILPYTGCHRRNGQNFGRVFLMLNYTDITQNTYIQS